jgi:hypothetical protein
MGRMTGLSEQTIAVCGVQKVAIQQQSEIVEPQIVRVPDDLDGKRIRWIGHTGIGETPCQFRKSWPVTMSVSITGTGGLSCDLTRPREYPAKSDPMIR